MSRSLTTEDVGKRVLVKAAGAGFQETTVTEFSPSGRYVYLDGYMLGGWNDIAHVEVLEELPAKPARRTAGQ